MGVYIKGMKMPKCCEECWDTHLYIAINCNNYGSGDELSPNCPLIEVKAPHGDLIDRGELQSRVSEEYRAWDNDYDALQILGDIEDAPTVIEAEVE